MPDHYFVVVLPLPIPFFMHVLDSNLIAYLGAKKVSATEYALDYLGCLGPIPCADNLGVLFSTDQAA
jgi:hypothetical protein